MENCNLQIEFYRPERAFFTGDLVQGWVRVSAKRAVRCEDLRVRAGWVTGGHGNAVKQNYHRQTLFQGAWRPGGTYEYAFEFAPPESPLTFHGELFNVTHWITAEAEIDGPETIQCEEPFLLRLRAGWPSSKPNLDFTSGPIPQARSNLAGFGLGIAMLATGLVLAILWSGWYLPVSLIGLVLMLFTRRESITKKRLGDVQIKLESDTVDAGSTLPLTVSLNPAAKLRLNQIKAKLEGIEQVHVSENKQTNCLRHRIERHERVLCRNLVTLSGQRMELSESIRLPELDAWTIHLPNNQLRWILSIEFQIAWWPSVTISREIFVLPQPIVPDNPNPVFQAQSTQDFLRMLNRLDRNRANEQEAHQLMREIGDYVYQIEIAVDCVVPTDCIIDDTDYQDGSSIVGTIAGSECTIVVHLPTKISETTDELKRGSTWSGCGTPIQWDPATDRIMVLGI